MDTKDEFLSQRVYSLFHEIPGLGHCPIKAVCQDGVVYLKGKVDTREHRDLAESLAGNIGGVREVVNQLSLFDDNLGHQVR